jgi:serine/threonine protein kinase
MPLSAGTRLGPYEIVALLGAGGMGEVFRAHDTKLGRDVALKILPDTYATDLERLARFQREAQVLASLNHPHIGAIYGLEESNGIRALVLELVEGPTLADRIAQGAIPLDEALPIARQIAEALEAAHEQGIIHRDLKPANIKLRPDGVVKVLDFGLAKLTEARAASGAVGLSQSPTITTPAMMTGVGMILGTAAYMSPEQAKGRPADKRSDVWAFGCVLYEMLTQKRAFAGEDVSDTLASVLRGEPHWSALPTETTHLTSVLQRCLEKDVKRRLRDVADVTLLLEAPPASHVVTPDAPSKSCRRHLPSSTVGFRQMASGWPTHRIKAAVRKSGYGRFRARVRPFASRPTVDVIRSGHVTARNSSTATISRSCRPGWCLTSPSAWRRPGRCSRADLIPVLSVPMTSRRTVDSS